MAVKELLDSLGLAGADLVAGFAGGLLNVLFFKKVSPWDAIASMAAGVFVAGYLGEPIVQLLHLPDTRVWVGAVDLVIGFGGFSVLGNALSFGRQRLGANGKGGPNA
jgi:Na+/proline symporter